jgi:hypothetical protein
MSNLPVDEILDYILWLDDEYFYTALENLSRLFITFQCICEGQLRTEYERPLIL